MTKLNELLIGNSNVIFATTVFNGLNAKFRYTWDNQKNTDAYRVQIKVEREKWDTFKWVHWSMTIDELIKDIETEYTHLTLTKSIKVVARRQARKSAPKQKHYIKISDPQPGQATTAETDNPLFTLEM